MVQFTQRKFILCCCFWVVEIYCVNTSIDSSKICSHGSFCEVICVLCWGQHTVAVSTQPLVFFSLQSVNTWFGFLQGDLRSVWTGAFGLGAAHLIVVFVRFRSFSSFLFLAECEHLIQLSAGWSAFCVNGPSVLGQHTVAVFPLIF